MVREKKHGSDELGHVPSTRVKMHDCSGMMLDFNDKHPFDVGMMCHQEVTGEKFQEEIKPSGKDP